MRIRAGRRAIPRELHRLVEATWFYESGSGEERTAADECSSLVVDLDASTTFVCGPEPTFRPIRGAPGARFVGVRLRPGAVAELFDVPGREMAGRMMAFEDVLPAREHRLVTERLGTTETTAIDALFAFLARRAQRPRRSELSRVNTAVTYLASAPPMAIDRVVRELDTSERTLRREFGEWIGLGPKVFTRVLRFRHAARGLRATRSLTALAADSGYADHAHMTREFVALAGLTPSELQRTSMPFMPNRAE